MKKAIAIILVAAMIFTFVGCSREQEVKTLRLGSMPTQSAAIYAVGVEKDIFKKHGVNIDLTIFKSAPERDAAAVAGELDGFMTDMMGHINLIDKGYKFQITSYEYENFGIMANKQSGIVDKAQLDEEKIGIAENTVTEYVVDQLLENSKIEKTQFVKIPDRLAAVLSNDIQLGVFPEPFTSIIKAKGGNIVVSSTEQGLQPVILVFSEESIRKKNKEIKSFYKAYNETVDYMQEISYDEYKDVLIQYGLSKEETIDKIKLPVDKFAHAKMPNEDDFYKVVEWMKKKGLTEKAYNLQDVSSDEFVK
ncbi:ABC transporter substrate-binding protein [Wukongibacter baidiensis]|uniref:ABC transporter substrate-binding protein n=1 Tax=Wukongibacter baidiensis TaxID=1723361 RepID=UPI003D7F5D2D